MAGLIYFIPNVPGHGLNKAIVDAAGIGYAFDTRIVGNGVRGGPDGQNGAVVVDPRSVDAHLIGYYPHKQQWAKVPNSDAWVGYYTEHPPTPKDVAREQQLQGHWVTLGDEQKWLCPVAREHLFYEDGRPAQWQCALPSTNTIDEQGNWASGGVAPKYRPLWDVALAWWDTITAKVEQQADEESDRIEFDYSSSLDSALLAIQCNYKIGKAEVALLGLFTDIAVGGILNALIDWPTFLRWREKKMELDGSTTGAG